MDLEKVFVTGAGGFIGSHLCEHLCQSGYQVRALVHYNSQNSWGWLDRSPIRKEIEVVLGDIRDFDGVFKFTHGVGRVFHLAALIGIPYSYESPLAYIKTNVEGTYNVLESCRRLGVGRVMLTSTSEVYGTARYAPIDEKHPNQPQSPYSASKISSDQVGLSYFNSFKTPVVIARPFNTFGPRQSARAILPTIATQMLAGSKTIKLGNTSPTRDLTFVKDTVRAMEIIAKTDTFLGTAVNIGTGNEISVADLFEKIKRILGSSAEIVTDDQRVRPATSEVDRLLSTNAYLRKHSNWAPQFTFEEGLAHTLEWLKENLSLYKADIFNV